MSNAPSFQRSIIMAAIKSRDTQPEMTVRRLLHADGHRYRLHASELPGKPDIVFRRHRKAIFVHGCFWHGHDCPRGSRVPKTNTDYWLNKIARNRARDAEASAKLQASGWRSLIIWECETLCRSNDLHGKLEAFLRD